MTAGTPPPRSVIEAFELSGEPEALPGGQETAWRVGTGVLKPVDQSVDELVWRADLTGRLAHPRFRLPAIVPARDGTLAVDGWFAQEWLAGRHERLWAEILEVGDAFLDAVSAEPRPSFLAARDDAWAIADRFAWEEIPPDGGLHGELLERLLAARRPVPAAPQLIHADLATNVLFSDHEPPAIIDLSPAWRPRGYQSAVVVVDAMTWEDADESILALVSHIPELDQLLVRALIFRIVTDGIFAVTRGEAPSDALDYAAVADLVLGRTRS